MIDEKAEVIRTALMAGLFWLNESNRPNHEIDAAFRLYEKLKNDISSEANNKLGRAIYGEEWSVI